jgi:hypothetical protein
MESRSTSEPLSEPSFEQTNKSRTTRIGPDLLIIGAGKAGTTSLHDYLSQHPDLYMTPSKEAQHFLFGEPNGLETRRDVEGLPVVWRTCVESREEYLRLFADAGTRLAGESSPPYLYDPHAPARIHRAVPDVKLIAILRDPVERAFSNYERSFQFGAEPELTFEKAIELEEIDAPDFTGRRHHVRPGFYGRQIERYLQLFSREQILILEFRRFSKSPLEAVRETCRFLGVDDTFSFDVSKRENATAAPRSRVMHKLLSHPSPVRRKVVDSLPGSFRRMASRVGSSIRQANSAGRGRLDPATRKRLQAVYADDTRKLEELTGMDFGHWRE